MPRNQPQVRDDPRQGRASQVNELLGDEPDVGSLVKMLSELYGINQEQENNPHKQAYLDSQTGENQAHERYYDTISKDYGSTHRKMMDDMQSLSFLFGSPDRIPDGIKKAMLQRAGFNPDDAFTPPTQGEMTEPQIHGTSTPQQSSIPHKIDSTLKITSPLYGGLRKYNQFVTPYIQNLFK